jgi:hypothetical protein
MHALVLPGVGLVDHINGSGLDNRRENLRPATASQNGMNKKAKRGSRSPYKGVTFLADTKRSRPWAAKIKVGEKFLDLGRFTNPRDAALAYDQGARKHFGEYARLNFPAAA